MYIQKIDLNGHAIVQISLSTPLVEVSYFIRNIFVPSFTVILVLWDETLTVRYVIFFSQSQRLQSQQTPMNDKQQSIPFHQFLRSI